MKICEDCDRRCESGDVCPDDECGGELRDPVTECRRCTECPGLSHHWMEMCIDGVPWEYSPEPMPAWACKHCDFFMPYDDPDDPEAQLQRSLSVTDDDVIEDLQQALDFGKGPVRNG